MWKQRIRYSTPTQVKIVWDVHPMLYLTNKNENVISTVFASYAHGFQTFTSGECLETVMGVWGRVCPALAGDRERRRCKRRAILGQGPGCVTSTVRFFVTAACLSGRRLAPKWSLLLRVLFTVEMDMTWHDMSSRGIILLKQVWNAKFKKSAYFKMTYIMTWHENGSWCRQPKTGFVNLRRVYACCAASMHFS